MRTKTLAQIDGILGLITGIILAILPFTIMMIATMSNDEDAAAAIVGMMFIVFAFVKIAILILGILTLVYYNLGFGVYLCLLIYMVHMYSDLKDLRKMIEQRNSLTEENQATE